MSTEILKHAFLYIIIKLRKPYFKFVIASDNNSSSLLISNPFHIRDNSILQQTKRLVSFVWLPWKKSPYRNVYFFNIQYLLARIFETMKTKKFALQALRDRMDVRSSSSKVVFCKLLSTPRPPKLQLLLISHKVIYIILRNHITSYANYMVSY